ncbi:MAG: YceI family protein [Pseudomonadota bacterium]
MKSLFFVLLSIVSISAFAAQTPDGAYALDKDHAHIGFSVSHLGFSNVIGRFNSFDGDVGFEAGGNSSVRFSVDAASVDTNQSRRDDHIRSADFFDTDSYPKVTFQSTAITYDDQGDPKTITGNMSFHGEVNAVTFEVSNVGAGEFRGTKRAGYLATGKINRSEFGMDTFAGVVGEEITITVNLELIKK